MNFYNNGDKVYTVGDIDRLERENAELKSQADRIKTEINAIINDSQGVAGYHLNGDVALWDEFYLLDILQETPAQCLAERDAEVKAKAVEDAINACKYCGSDGQAWLSELEQCVINLQADK